MTTSDTGWQREFGVYQSGPPTFFTNKDDLRSAATTATQVYVLRRAFDLLGLDGVFCTSNSPLIYFKQAASIDVAELIQLHRRFWNHGGAPILVLITPTEIHIYSGLSKPMAEADAQGHLPSLVEIIDRTSVAIREFLPSVESGEYFRRHARSFNPEHRVDRCLLENLQATRQELSEVSSRALDPVVLDALLCRLVFTCYLFDRHVIGSNYLKAAGAPGATHLRDLLGTTPRSDAKNLLYGLFRKLGEDFNGDLFNDNLDAEAARILAGHIDLLDTFFRATDVMNGQQSFWPYDFGVIPIETISAIYERFLRPSHKKTGTFYTPRFLAELVLDAALIDTKSLLDERFLDPACGSGIFLVGLFNRMAEEWNQANPDARNERRSRELMKILRDNLFGIDINPTACRITAFSLYLAYLDQLSPRDIQELQEKGRALPRLVNVADSPAEELNGGNIWCADFFAEDAKYPSNVNFVVGNPPWGSIATSGTPAADWCTKHNLPIPDKQIAAAFVWKAPRQLAANGKICFVLPYGILFNHSKPAIAFQKALFRTYAVNRVLNLADYQRFLFDEAGHPAIVLSYRALPPSNPRDSVDYWALKADWTATRAEIITVSSDDRSSFTVQQVLDDLDGRDAPQIWKRRFWATPRDWRLLDRLSLYPRLRDCVRRPGSPAIDKRWVMAEGFQPLGQNDDPATASTIRLPSNLFVSASSANLELFLLEEDCIQLPSPEVRVRERSNKSTQVFEAPHVLVAHGFTSVAFADFAVSFRHALRGITGATSDKALLAFLSAYLRSPIARYFLFHTSSNWGVSRQEVHVEELLRLPFPLPDSLSDPNRAWKIVREVAGLVTSSAEEAKRPFSNREELVQTASEAIEPLLEEYFDILPVEKLLLQDTISVIIPSVRPTRERRTVPTIAQSTPNQRSAYNDRICDTLNTWANGGSFVVQGQVLASGRIGFGLATLEKSQRGTFAPTSAAAPDLLGALDQLRVTLSQKLNTFEMVRGIKVFDGNRLYIVKPLAYRYWTQTAALNDADEIAGSILMHAQMGADEHRRSAE
jgi:hypothetical protein